MSACLRVKSVILSRNVPVVGRIALKRRAVLAESVTEARVCCWFLLDRFGHLFLPAGYPAHLWSFPPHLSTVPNLVRRDRSPI
jgi:hypothetical protein